MLQQAPFSGDTPEVRSGSYPSPYEERLRLLLSARVQEAKKKEDYCGYTVPTMMVGPMMGYGTWLEPFLAWGIAGCGGIYAAVHFLRAGERKDQLAN